MPEDKEDLYFDEDTLKKVYEGLMAVGIYGQAAVDAVNQIQNRGILFRENKPKRRGRPPKGVSNGSEEVIDRWTPKGATEVKSDAPVSQ